MTYSEWCGKYGCDHAHCPNECDHPQPFIIEKNRLICGRCAILDKEIVEMVPCSPEICD